MMKSAPDKYGSVAISIHWLSAILIIVLFASGFKAGGMDAAEKAQFLRVHVPVGIAIGALTLLRIVWWLFADRKPREVPGPKLQQFGAKMVHYLLYCLLLVMVGSGMGMLILSNAGPAIFGSAAGSVPDFTQYRPRAPHGAGAFLTLALLAAHVLAALYHQFIRRDQLINRMWYGR